MIYKLENPSRAAELFGDWEETILWSCLQGIMGRIYVDDVDNPAAAKAVLGDFVFLAGMPNEELVRHEIWKGLILVPQNEAWAQCIEQTLGATVQNALRYAILKEENVFDKEKLQQFAAKLPPEYELKSIDASLYQQC